MMYVRNHLWQELEIHSPNIPLLNVHPNLDPNFYWLEPMLLDNLARRTNSDLGHETMILDYYYGLEQTFACAEDNCVNHTSWAFHFVEFFDIDTELLSDTTDQLETEIYTWLSDLLPRKFPSLEFTRETLLDSQLPITLRTHSYF